MARLMYHSNYSSLAKDIVSLVDDYKEGKISEEELQEYADAWSANCPSLLFDKGDTSCLSPSIRRKTGKRREIIFLTALKDSKN